MKRKWTWMLVAAALALAGGVTAALARQGRELDTSFRSISLRGPVHALVVVPPGYDEGTTRYPVVYFLHGLPATATTYRSNRWIEQVLARVGPAILVEPQGARRGDSDAEYLDWGAGRNWESYVSRELPNYIDAHFRTIRSRGGRALVGLSAGGFGATLLALDHLDRFSVVESWSGYFHPTDPTGTRPLDRGPRVDVHRLIADLHADQQRRPTFFAFYVGRGDTRFRAENELLHRELTAAHVPHVFDVYGGAHDTDLWRAHAAVWLRLAMAHLQRP